MTTANNLQKSEGHTTDNCGNNQKVKKENEKRVDNRGIDPLTYRMRSDRSTIWANYPWWFLLNYALQTSLQPQWSNHFLDSHTTLMLSPSIGSGTLIHCGNLGLIIKIASFLKPANQKKCKMDNGGIDPPTYRMQSDRSTIWANYP